VRAYLSSFWLKLLIWTAIGVILVNDGGAILMGYYRVGDEAERVAREALRNYRLYDRSPQQALRAALLKAEQDGALLTGFEITREAVRVAVEIRPGTTWVAHRIKSLRPYLSAQGQIDLPLNTSL